MDVATNCDFFIRLPGHINKWLLFLKDVFGFLNYHRSVFLVQSLLFFLVLHHRLDPVWANVLDFLKSRPIIIGFNNNFFSIDFDFLIVIADCILELSKFFFLNSFIIFQSCVFVVGLHFTDTSEVFNGKINLIQSQMGWTFSVICLHIHFIIFNCFLRVEQC